MVDADLQAAFLTQFGAPATHAVEAPGRVNLIGDHTDYNDLPVLPMALRQRVRLAVRPREDSTVRLVPLAAGLEPVTFQLASDIERASAGHWSNYPRGAAQAVARLEGTELRGFDALVTSDLPVAAGLSSSSALVVSVVMTLLALSRSGTPQGLPDLSKLEIAALAARAERYVGTEGGGMDQATSVCGRSGHALRMRFAPLRVDPIPVPESWCFVVAHSGVVAEKSGHREGDYNERVASCRSALRRMAGVVGEAAAKSYPALVEAVPVEELLRSAETVLSPIELRRFRHTITEAGRVEAAVEALIDEDAPTFGSLMTASHTSLAKDYDVSTDLLDAMVGAALTAGAFGARLTGAGFGGSVVALAEHAGADSVLAALTATVADASGASEAPAFIAVASDGARVTPLS